MKTLLDTHVRNTIRWHFSPDTGTPFWLDWAATKGIDVVARVTTFGELVELFPLFQEDWLRFEPPERWTPRFFARRPFYVFETGGTTGMPKQRLNWEDFQHDYEEFSATLSNDAFPPGGHWLMMGPTGPRRLRLAIEHLAHFRGSSVYFVDLDPRWVKKLISAGHADQAEAYMGHVVDQAIPILTHRRISALFTTPRLLEALGERVAIPATDIRGVMCGGTEMSPQTVRFLIEEVLENEVAFVPVYGNTLMGLAHSLPPSVENGFSICYYPPLPRAVLRIVQPEDPGCMVEYGAWGRVELTTMTREFFMPRFLERDEAIRRPPCDRYAWDGAAEVRPFGAAQTKIVEGVY